MLKITKKVPQMTSQYAVCPIPYKLDPYTGCTYGCKYCCARDVIQSIRKAGKQEITDFSYVTGMDTTYFKKWVSRTEASESTSIERIAFQERLPVKIGGAADPFPYIEREQRITYEVLKTLHEIDYPVQMSTKNPEVLAEYVDDFINGDKMPNWAVSVTIITADEGFREAIEVGAPTIAARFAGIKKLTDRGIPVAVRVQPVFYPYIMTQLNSLIEKVKDSGAYAIIMEGLKVRIMMDKEEQEIYKQMSAYVGYDIRAWYKLNGRRTKTDYELKTEDKMIYINKAKELCSKHGLKFFAGDNDCRCEGCSGECCGTQILRGYRVIYDSDKLLDCRANFGRCGNGRTIRENIELSREQK